MITWIGYLHWYACDSDYCIKVIEWKDGNTWLFINDINIHGWNWNDNCLDSFYIWVSYMNEALLNYTRTNVISYVLMASRYKIQKQVAYNHSCIFAVCFKPWISDPCIMYIILYTNCLCTNSYFFVFIIVFFSVIYWIGIYPVLSSL